MHPCWIKEKHLNKNNSQEMQTCSNLTWKIEDENPQDSAPSFPSAQFHLIKERERNHKRLRPVSNQNTIESIQCTAMFRHSILSSWKCKNLMHNCWPSTIYIMSIWRFRLVKNNGMSQNKSSGGSEKQSKNLWAPTNLSESFREVMYST